MERNIQETSPNLTQLLNQTTSFSNESLANQLPMTSRRRRRGIGWRGERLDWWYGNWCGPYQGGYTYNPKPSCRGVCRTTSYVSSACRRCLPTKDGLDEACMEHDRWQNVSVSFNLLLPWKHSFLYAWRQINTRIPQYWATSEFSRLGDLVPKLRRKYEAKCDVVLIGIKNKLS